QLLSGPGKNFRGQTARGVHLVEAPCMPILAVRNTMLRVRWHMSAEREQRDAFGRRNEDKPARALRLSEERYRRLFDTIDEGFCICEVFFGADGAIAEVRYREVNPAFARHTGLHDVVGKSSRELFPNLESHWLQAATRAMQTGRPERMENHLADLGRWLDVQYSRVGGEDSRLLAVVFSDVTERKQIEITSSRLAAIVEGSDDAIIRKTLDGIIETWNAGAERIFGYTASEVIGKPVTILMPPDRLDEEPGILARLRRGERVDHYETVRRRKDGSLIDVALTVSPITNSHGNVVAASKIARDISQRKGVERLLRESERRHGFLLMLFDSMREQTDAETIAAVCVRMLARHLGVARCYIARRPSAGDRARMVAEYRAGDLQSAAGASGDWSLVPFPACMQRLEKEPLVVPDVGADTELAQQEKDALLASHGHATFVAALLGIRERDSDWVLVVANDTPRAWTREEIHLVEDVAHRASSAIDRACKDMALREREAELRRVSRAKDEFIAMLGHELRNPLAPIATTLQLMKLRAPDVLTRERGVIEAQVQHLTGLVNDLLDVARIATGKVELDSERVDIGSIVAAAVETTQPAMESSRQTLHVHLEEGLVVSGDRRRLVQVLVNLLGNAAKYSPPDRNVWLSADAEEGQVVLRVRDEGQGISPDLLPRIFESFIQDERALDRSRGGLGLGLSIVRSLVLLHGGSVTAASDGAYKGSEFTVRLPL